jgi:hypothetical protein
MKQSENSQPHKQKHYNALKELTDRENWNEETVNQDIQLTDHGHHHSKKKLKNNFPKMTYLPQGHSPTECLEHLDALERIKKASPMDHK